MLYYIKFYYNIENFIIFFKMLLCCYMSYIVMSIVDLNKINLVTGMLEIK